MRQQLFTAPFLKNPFLKNPFHNEPQGTGSRQARATPVSVHSKQQARSYACTPAPRLCEELYQSSLCAGQGVCNRTTPLILTHSNCTGSANLCEI